MKLFLSIFSFLIGCLVIYGAYKRWDWLVDPPQGSSQAFLKNILGKESLTDYVYSIGFIITGFSLFFFLYVYFVE